MEDKLIKQEKIKGFIYVCVSALLFASKGILIKLAYNEKIDPLSLLTFRMIFAVPFFVGIGLWLTLKEHPKIPLTDYILLIILGLIGYYYSSLLDFYGLEYVTAGMERLILFIYPTMVAVFSAIIFKKKITKIMAFSLLMTYVGIMLVVVYDLSFNGIASLPGIIYIFLSAFTFALYLVFSDNLVHKFGSIRFSCYIMTTSSIGVFTHYLINHSPSQLLGYSNNIYMLALGLGTFGTVIPAFLMTDGIKKIGARNTAITSTLGPIFTIILAAIILGEPITFIQIAGTALVTGGVLLTNLYKGK
mgnify:CR=1 FL=1